MIQQLEGDHCSDAFRVVAPIDLGFDARIDALCVEGFFFATGLACARDRLRYEYGTVVRGNKNLWFGISGIFAAAIVSR